MDFGSVLVVRPYEQIVEQLRHAFVKSRLLPGERLPIERELSEHYGVNRRAVHEAIKMRSAQRSTQFRHGSSVDALNLSVTTVPLFPHVFQRELEATVARLAAIRRTDQHREQK